MKIRIGTRKSRLAMIQTEIVKTRILASFPNVEIEVIPMNTLGDKILNRSLTSFGGKGVFTKELNEALLDGSIDLAVHSAKDMPTEFVDGLAVGAVLERADAGDVLVTRDGIPAKQLAPGSIIGTSSLRRELQIKRLNPQLEIRMLRGNVETRLDKLRNGEYDGILLAAAGLERLGQLSPEGLHLEYLDKEMFVPAPGQGILAVEIRSGELADIMAAIHSEEAAAILYAEREYLMILGGGCNAPCGAYCRKEGSRMVMTAMYAQDGQHPVYRKGSCELRASGQITMAVLARRLAENLALQVCGKMVSLVGAGPGDAGLLTRKGLECVRRADVIIYDNLISGSILNEARLDARLLYAGKRSGHHHLPQDEINELLVSEARLGHYVVRLKGGDPFVFGRGGEEAQVLKEHGIPYEIVPGVSASYSVPAYAGIPVTSRGVASSFHVITGHRGHHSSDRTDYSALAKIEGTLVFLMGLGNLKEITEQLMAHGKAGNIPAAVIEQGTTAGQRKVISTIETVAADAEKQQIKTPAIVVIGEAVALEAQLDWFGKAPLSGKRVLITGTRHMAAELEAELAPLGAETVAVSIIETRPLITDQVTQALRSAAGYQWLLFTSGNGVDIFFETLRILRLDIRTLMHLKFAAIGRKTAAALENYGIHCDFVPDSFSGADLAKEWIPLLKKEEKVIMFRAKDGMTILPQELKRAGITFSDIPLYETWTDERRTEELKRAVRSADYVTLASGSAAAAFGRMLDGEIPAHVKVISIGPSTTKAAQELGLTVHKSTGEYTAAGIAAAILADAVSCREAAAGQPAGQMSGQTISQTISQTAGPGTGPAAGKEPPEVASDIRPEDSAPRFPMFFSLSGKQVLIVGAGRVASRRAEILAQFGADIQVIAPESTEQIKKMAAGHVVQWERRCFQTDDIQAQFMVFAATDNGILNNEIVKLCRTKQIFVNHAGDRMQSDFYFPGIAREGSMVLGVTASGADHRLASDLTGKLQQWLRTSVQD